MRVSVIIPTHNYGRYLGPAIESLRRQSFSNWECIVVDDGSSDETPEVMRAFADARIRLVRQEQAGPSSARNRGLAESTGEFVQFLDADDLLGSMKLEAQVGILDDRPDVDLAYCGALYFRDELGSLASSRMWLDHPPLRAGSGSGLEMLSKLVDENIAVVEAPLVRRSLMDRVGGFNPDLRRMEDWEYWLRCALAGARFLYDPRDDPAYLCHVRVHESGISGDRIAMLESYISIREEIHDRLPDPELRRLNLRRLHEQSAELGIREGLENAPARGIRRLLRSGIAEKRPKWLAWALLLPFLRSRIGRQALARWRSRRPAPPN